MKKVAFFDIDGTLFRSSLLIELVEKMIEREIFPPEARKGYEIPHDRWVNRKGSYEEYINAVVAVFMKHLKGVHYGEFADIAEIVIQEQASRVYRFSRDLVRELHADNYYLVAISQSPKTILDSFCKRHGFDKVYGRIYEIGPQDCFTGVVQDEHLIANKANIVRRVVQKEGLTLDGSIGVGDSEGDIPLLEIVERPICFNPTNVLYRHAERLSWEVVVERKDVIYTL
ncbi:MAG: HAD-IB family phosphatase [Candidatus Paceibacterota bacterium]